MKSLVGISVACLIAASVCFGASLTKTRVSGDYVEARTADVYTGPCFANGEVNMGGKMAVFGWKVRQGEWQGVKIDDLAVVAAIRSTNTLGDVTQSAYPVKSILIIDDRANSEQRLALKSFAQRMGGDLLQDIVRVEYQPIEFSFANGDMHSMKATVKAGTLADIETRAIAAMDHICHNEDVYYDPLTKLNHAMPAVAVAHDFRGQGLDTQWSSPDKRSAFLGTFSYQE